MLLTTVGTGSSGNCYILQSNDHKLILDAGRPVKEVKIALKFNVSNIDGCLITHVHKDHYLHAKDFENMGIPTWKPFEHEEGAQIRQFGRFRVVSIPLKSKDGWVHSNSDGTQCPIYAYMIEVDDKRILYMTDFFYSPLSFKTWHINTFIIECHHNEGEVDDQKANYNHILFGHPSASITKKIVEINNSQELENVLLCHMSAVSNSRQMIEEIKEVVSLNVRVMLCKKGETIQL